MAQRPTGHEVRDPYGQVIVCDCGDDRINEGSEVCFECEELERAHENAYQHRKEA